jgi:predicted nucleotidyltransferase
MKKIPENINKVISEFITAINNKFGDRIKKIILYGSYARGDFNIQVLI